MWTHISVSIVVKHVPPAPFATILVFHQLVVQPSVTTASTLRDGTLQSAVKLWKTQQAPANHVNTSQRMTFPDASVFPLHWCVTACVGVCVCVCVYTLSVHITQSMKLGHSCQIRVFDFNFSPKQGLHLVQSLATYTYLQFNHQKKIFCWSTAQINVCWCIFINRFNSYSM